jgi:hypothetical protein
MFDTDTLILSGIRIVFDRRRHLVNLMAGNFCVDQMTLDDFASEFGLRAASMLVRGTA